MNFKYFQLNKKILGFFFTLISVVGYGVIVFAATPPAGGFVPGAELNPTCLPGHSIANGDPYDCFVKQAWQQNVADGFVYNTSDNVGIGTNTPAAKLDVAGDFRILTEVLTGGVFTKHGDLADFGGDYGIATSVLDDLVSPVALGLSVLDFNSGNPLYSLNVGNGTNSLGFDIRSADGLISMSALDSNGAGSLFELATTANLLGGSQYFDLSASYVGDPDKTVGFEAQEGIDGLKAKMYYSTVLGSSNIQVIEVGPENIVMAVDNDNVRTVFNTNGVVLPLLAAEPAGETGALYYNSTTGKFRGYENSNWVDLIGAIAGATNGLQIIGGNVGLGGSLTQDTDIDLDGSAFSITDTYASYQSGVNNLGLTSNWIRKDISPTTLSVIGMLDLSGFGEDADSIVIGRLDLLGGPVTSVSIEPTSGNILVETVNDLIMNATNAFAITSGSTTNFTSGGNMNMNNVNLSVTSTENINLNSVDTFIDPSNNLYINPDNDLFLSPKNGWFGGVNNGITTAGNYRVDFSMVPYDTDPAMVWELKKLQTYAIGYAAIDSVGKKYSNIYYGVLDSSNIITDVTRIEAADVGASAEFIYDQLNGRMNRWELNSSGFSMFTTGAGVTGTFELSINGNAGIGTVAATDKLSVGGDIRVGTSSTNGCLKDFSGGTITGTCSSDERLKMNIQPVTNILDRLTNINLVTYDWNDIAQSIGFKGNTSQLGVLAQNVEQYFPELVITDKDGYKQVNYGRLNLLNLQAIKELNLKVKSIETVINTDRVNTKQLCVEDVCVTRDQFLYMVQQSGQTPITPSSPAPEPTEDDSTIETPIPAEMPAPASEPENIPQESTPVPDFVILEV